MGKDRRKKDGSQKKSAALSSGDSAPKGQREPRNRTPQESKEQNKSNDGENLDKDKSSEVEPPPQTELKIDPPDTKELFANLKRETDDILALKQKKVHRQIISNWSRYEEPLPRPDQETEIPGADFTALLEAPDNHGHFQFKSEKNWGANVAALSGELFSLDINLLADGLATIPFYKKLDISTSLFSGADLENMDEDAERFTEKFESTKKSKKLKDTEPSRSLPDIVEILMMKESSPAPSEESKSVTKTSDVLKFDIQPETQNEEDMVMSNENSTQKNPAESSIEHREKEIFNKTKLISSNIVQVDSKTKEDTPTELANVNIFNSSTSKSEDIQSPKTEDVNEMSNEAEWSADQTPEPAVPLGQRSARRKPRGQTQNPQVQNVDNSEKSHQMDNDLRNEVQPVESQETLSGSEKEVDKSSVQQPDQRSRVKNKKCQEMSSEVKKSDEKCQKSDNDALDFLLSLKKPVRDSPTPVTKTSHFTKPTIEDDDNDPKFISATFSNSAERDRKPGGLVRFNAG